MLPRNHKYCETAQSPEQPGATDVATVLTAEEEESSFESNSELFAEIALHDEDAEETLLEPSQGGTPSASTEVAPAVAEPAAVAPEPSVPPVAPSPPAPTVAMPPAVQAVGVPPSEQPVPASAAAPEPQSATGVPEQIDFEKHRTAILPKLEELYKLSDDEAEEARLDPSTTLPKLAARLHFEVTQAAMNSVLGVLPGLIEQVTETKRVYAERENQFYSRWGELKKPEYKETVINSVKAYKAANPRATTEELVERAGLMAMLSLGLTPQQAAVIQQQASPQPAPRQVPPSPAGVGNSAAPFRGSQVDPNDPIASLVEAELAGFLD